MFNIILSNFKLRNNNAIIGYIKSSLSQITIIIMRLLSVFQTHTNVKICQCVYENVSLFMKGWENSIPRFFAKKDNISM